MKKMKITTFVLAILIGLSSCKKEEVALPAADHRSENYILKSTTNSQPCGTPTVVMLIAAQRINVGTVTVSNDATNLKVTYATTGGWNLQELHLYVGDLALIPDTRQGIPIPGQFPHSVYLNRCVSQYTFTIPLSTLGSCFIIAADAKVTRFGSCETAWGAGTRFSSGNSCNWATYFSYCEQTCVSQCILPPNILLTGEVPWPNGGASITVGGYVYTQSSTMPIAISAVSSDAKNALIYVATLKIYGNKIYPPAEVLSNATIIENWLSTLGQLTVSSSFTAPANVEAAIDSLFAWEASHYCQ